MCDKKSRHGDNSSESFSAHLQRKSVFSISLTNVSFHGNFGHSFGHPPCPLGARCLPQVRKLLAPHGQACCPFIAVLRSLPMVVALLSAKQKQPEECKPYCIQKFYQTVVRQGIPFHTIPSPYSPTIQTITRWFQRANKGGNTCISTTFASTTRWLTIFWKNEVIYQNRTGRQSRTSFKTYQSP